MTGVDTLMLPRMELGVALSAATTRHKTVLDTKSASPILKLISLSKLLTMKFKQCVVDHVACADGGEKGIYLQSYLLRAFEEIAVDGGKTVDSAALNRLLAMEWPKRMASIENLFRSNFILSAGPTPARWTYANENLVKWEHHQEGDFLYGIYITQRGSKVDRPWRSAEFHGDRAHVFRFFAKFVTRYVDTSNYPSYLSKELFYDVFPVFYISFIRYLKATREDVKFNPAWLSNCNWEAARELE